MDYSLRLYSEIKEELLRINFQPATPKKVKSSNLFYFTINHISIFFSFLNSEIVVKLVWDERRDPGELVDRITEMD